MTEVPHPCVCKGNVRPRQEAPQQSDQCESWQQRGRGSGTSGEMYWKLDRGEMDLPDCSAAMGDGEDGEAETFAVDQPMDATDSPQPSLTRLDELASLRADESHESESNPSFSFHVDLPLEEVARVQEVTGQELAEDPLPESIMEDGPTTYELISGGSRKGGDLVTDSRGFQYVKKRQTGVATTWICSVRTAKHRCHATVDQRGEVFVRGSHDHNHQGTPGLALKSKARAQMKKAARSKNPSSSFHVDLPLEEVARVQEASLAEEPLPESIMEDGPTTYELISGGSRKGGDLLTDSRGFQYVRKRQTGVATTWVCSVRTPKHRCHATVNQRGEEFVRGSHDHNHQGSPGGALKSKARVQVKEAARSNVFMSSGKIVTETLKKLDSEGVELPSFGNLQRSANRAREKQRPKQPTDLDFELRMTHVPEDFLQRDIRQDDQRHLVFASPLQLTHLAKAKMWFVDGTFKVAKEPFTQLLTIHSFIRSGEAMKQVPLCSVVMSRRRTSDYRAVLEAVLSMLPSEPVCSELILDFEKALWKAVRKAMPDVAVFGCWFHWAQAVYRKVEEFGLGDAYVSQTPVQHHVRQLMALPNLPADHIREAFYTLKGRCPVSLAPSLVTLLEYMEKTWITSSTCPPSSWSTFKRAVRTHDDAEGWHGRLNAFATHSLPNLYMLITMLHEAASLLPLEVKLVSQKKLYKARKKVVMSKQEQLQKLWCDYENRSMSASDCLAHCSFLADHSED